MQDAFCPLSSSGLRQLEHRTAPADARVVTAAGGRAIDVAGSIKNQTVNRIRSVAEAAAKSVQRTLRPSAIRIRCEFINRSAPTKDAPPIPADLGYTVEAAIGAKNCADTVKAITAAGEVV